MVMPNISNYFVTEINELKSLENITDSIANIMPLSFEEKYKFLEDDDASSRGDYLITLLQKERNVGAIEKDLEEKKDNKVVKTRKKIYFGYLTRVIVFAIAFILCLGTSLLLVFKSLNVDSEKVTVYEESGNLDYRVYLKPNEFYETPYLSNDMTYIAKLINNIEVDVNYMFNIGEKVDMDFTYDVIANVTISNSDRQKLFEKEYTLISQKEKKVTDDSVIVISDKLNIDYDQYNNLANDFKSTFGVETVNSLDIYVRLNKVVTNKDQTINLSNSSQMSLTIPLTEKTINISLNNTDLNNRNSIIEEKKVSFKNITFVVIAGILFIVSVAAILKTLELVALLFKKDSKYDKYIKKILNDYDRLIVETETEPNFKGANVIKISRFQELLDVRDNLKRPIMYYCVSSHLKSYFYILYNSNCYLMVVKAVDIDNGKLNDNKRANKI